MRNWLFVVFLAAAACNRPVSHDQKMVLLADRTCRAIGIRQQRFALADQIRFAEDTLFKTKSKSDSARLTAELAHFAGQRADLLKKSLALADTIRSQLDSIMPFTDKVAQQRFTRKLDSLLARKGCMTKTEAQK
jgi:uncharacterized membrane protein